MLSTRIFRSIHCLLATLTLGISTLVILGWVLRSAALIQLNPSMAPMVFNTALCLFLLSLGFLFSEAENSLVRKGLSVLVMVIATLTLLQFLTGLDFSLDTFFIDPHYGHGMRTHGRMSVSASSCLLIMALVLFFKRSGSTYRMLAVTGASLAMGFAFISTIGYILEFNPEYGWGSFSRMAFHTSTCILLLAFAMLWQLYLELRQKTPQRRALIPFVVVMVGVLTSMTIWHFLVLGDQERNKNVVLIRSEAVKANLDNAMLPLQRSLESMARRFVAGTYTSKQVWLVDAESHYADVQGLKRLIWSDASGIARWVYPMSDGGEKVQDTIFVDSKVPPSTVTMSRIFELKTGGRGFVLQVPIFRGGIYKGAVSAVIWAAPFFSHLTNIEGYNLIILEDGREIFSKGAPDPAFARYWLTRTLYKTFGVNWEIVLVPTGSAVRANTSPLPGVVLLFGVSVSLLLGVALNFYMRSRESERTAKEAFEWKKASMNSIPLLMVSLDEKTMIREMNATAERLLEYTTEELSGKTNPTIFHDAREVRDLRDKMEELFRQPINAGSDFINCFMKLGLNKATEWTVISKSGKHFAMILSVSEIRDGAGKVTGYLEVLEDVTELREKERLLKEQEMKILASSRLASLGEMAAGIAHEINNPLAIINGHVGVMRRMMGQKGLTLDEELNRKMEAIETMVHRIAKIIRGLRSYARESDATRNESVKVEALVEDTLAFCYEKFRTEGVDLNVSIEPNVSLKCRPYQLAQVLLNLLNNALDAVLSSKVKKVTLDVRRRDGGVEIGVMDTGPGVPYHLRTKIMEPFFTTKEVGKGLGLGLSISQGIVQSHGGKFYLDESSAKTRFVIWIPDEEVN